LIRSSLVALAMIAMPALAQDQPETVYANFHRAGLAADYDTMRKYESAAKLNQMDRIPPAERKAILQALAKLLPSRYAVVEKTVEEGAKRAVLRLRGTQPAVSGTITFVKEKGEWKVDDANWGER
jgi:acyl-CoA reductase-like NAD-dependent aldehyde dehydrogenase